MGVLPDTLTSELAGCPTVRKIPAVAPPREPPRHTDRRIRRVAWGRTAGPHDNPTSRHAPSPWSRLATYKRGCPTVFPCGGSPGGALQSTTTGVDGSRTAGPHYQCLPKAMAGHPTRHEPTKASSVSPPHSFVRDFWVHVYHTSNMLLLSSSCGGSPGGALQSTTTGVDGSRTAGPHV